MTAPPAREQRRPPSPPDRPSSAITAPRARACPLRPLFAAALLALSAALALPAAAQTTDPVWSATMTAGETRVGHGYDATDTPDTPAIGALDDDDFDYGSLPYRVLAIDVATNVVRFAVAPGGQLADETLTLEFGGHALAFSDRISVISIGVNFYWLVPAALDDLETEFPVGSTATVCLRTATQVCPTGSIVTPPTDANAAPTFSSSATFNAAENQTAAGTVLATDSDAGDDVTGYAITGGADQGFFSIGATSGALTFDAAPNFEDAKDSDTGNDYVVEVQATSGTGERVKTATQTITVTVTDVGGEKPGAPAAPTVAPASVTSLTVTWTKPANAGPAITDYDVQYREGTTGNWTDGGHTGTAVTATLSGLSENTSYQVQVRATNDEGTGDWSDAGSGTTDANAAPAFSSSATFDAAENQTSAGTVLATDSDADDDITGYAITGGADQGFFSIGATSGALTFDDAPNFEDAKDSDTGNDYVVEVQATSGTGTREKTATQTITVTVTDVGGEKPGAPAAPTVAPASVTSLTVTWTKPANAGPAITDYDVQYRTKSPVGDWTVVADTTSTALSATLSGLDEGTEYDVQVRAANADGESDWSASGSGATDANPAGVRVSATALTVTEQDATGDSYTVVLDTEPTHDVTVTVGGHAGTDVSLSSSTLTFTPSNWDQAQTVTVTARNDDDTANDAVALTHTATSTDGNYSGITIAGVSVTVTDNDTATPAVTLALSADSIGENGGVSTVTATVSPASAAAFTVTVAAAAVAPAVAADFRLSANQVLRFAENATTSTGSVTITGVDNDVDAADKTVTVSGTVSATGVTAPATRTLTLEDDDAAGVRVSATALTVTEQDATGDSYTVVLDTEPTHGVTVTVGGHAGTDVSLSSSTLTFTPSNWDQAQTVTVTARNDDDTANDAVALTHTATSTDGNYSGITIAGVSVTVTDNDTATPAVTLALSADSIGENGGVSTVTATVSPASAAAFTVTVAAAAVAPAVAADFRLSANQVLRFAENATTSTGSVTITGVDNDVDAADKTVTVSGTVSATSVTAPATRTLTLEDDDDATNAPPSFISLAEFEVEENVRTVDTVAAEDNDTGDAVTGYSITGGADQGFFSIGATSGALTFDDAPNFEDAQDQGAGNTYEVTVQATSGTGAREKTATQAITVTVTDVLEKSDTPDKPTLAAVPGSSTSLTATWTEPGLNGGPDTFTYTLRYREGTPGEWTTPAIFTDGTFDGTSWTITGLTVDTEYQAQVSRP